jgi:hypothetical protein
MSQDADEKLPAPFPDDRAARRPSIGTGGSGIESTRDPASEDFLFHLYRGSELLQENRVLEAKEELEYALTLQPRDPKGQDLLAAVYFRIGLYPRAIAIYEHLVRQFPRDMSLKVNLALCYLKTGQPEAARGGLEEVVRANPGHKRAWGYLALALEKLGDFDQAQVAFERGGHPMMAKRLVEKRRQTSRGLAPMATIGGAVLAGEVREVAGMAFEELDAGELNFALAEPGSAPDNKGTWHAVELGSPGRRPAVPSLSAPAPSFTPPPAPPSSDEAATVTPPPSDVASALGRLSMTAASVGVVRDAPLPSSPPPPMTRAARRSLLVFPPAATVALHPTGVVLAQTAEPDRPFAARLESMRVAVGTFSTRVLPRRTRGRDSAEVLGGVGSPLVAVSGDAQLVLGPRTGHQLVPLELDQDLAFVREDLLFGFDMRLAYENGRLSFEDASEGTGREGDGVPVVQLRGTGALVLELLSDFSTLELTAEGGKTRTAVVRREWVVGWIGRLLPRALPPAEAPAGQRGLVSFSGEGAVLLASAAKP